MSKNPGKGYWYFITLAQCPVCNRCDETRKRRNPPRPERWEDRHEVYDDCLCASRDVSGV